MTRLEIQQYLPELYTFFAECSDQHPFWLGVVGIQLRDVKRGKTLLPVFDRICGSVDALDGFHAVQTQIQNTTVQEEFMNLLTQIYVAYLYRDHGPRFIHGDHGYHIEVEIADQLLALGVVSLHDFSSPVIQFSDQISDTIEYLESLKKKATQFAQHPQARHHVLAAVTDHAQLHRTVELQNELRKQRASVQKHFPHLSGIVLIDPTPGREHAKFVPFHGEQSDLEQLLDKTN